MGFFESVKAQFKPSPEAFAAQHVEHDPATPAATAADAEKGNTGAGPDITDAEAEINEKAGFSAQPPQDGVARVMAIQAVWGKKGRYILIAG